MGLEDFSREIIGKAPKNRSAIDRMLVTDDSGSSYDQQVATVRLPLGIGLAAVVTAAAVVGLLLVGWASDNPAWTKLVGQIQAIANIF
jgi:hypothetical protein